MVLPAIRRRNVRGIFEDPFEAVQREFDRMLSRYGGEQGGEVVGAYPVDIHEDQDHVCVDAELPGFNKDEVQVTLEEGVLTITAERKAEEEQKGTKHLSERRFRRVERAFTLPTSVDPNKVEANLHDGVLHLKIGKREEVKPRRIEVK